MRTPRRDAWLWVTSLLVCWAPAVFAMPDFPAPPWAKVEWVTDQSTFNGMQMKARRFESAKPMEEVLDFYRQKWRQPVKPGLPGYLEDEFNGWRVLSRIKNGYLLTVQVQPDAFGKSWGYLGVSDLPKLEKIPELGKGVPKMRGSEVLNDILNKDPGKKGRTLVMSNGFSLQSNASFYRNHFTEGGWDSLFDQRSHDGKYQVMVYRNGNKEANIVLSRDGGKTNIVFNTVK